MMDASGERILKLRMRLLGFLLLFAIQIQFPLLLFIIKTCNPPPPTQEQLPHPILSLMTNSSTHIRSNRSIGHRQAHHLRRNHPIISCDRSHRLYDLCRLEHSSILDPTTRTFFTAAASARQPSIFEKIRPYPRKQDTDTMSTIREITLTTSPPPLNATTCNVQHPSPALVFSTGGFTGNFFHDFNDGILPLFITINTLFPDDDDTGGRQIDVVLVVTDYVDWWHGKYQPLLPRFTRHPIVNLDNQTGTHCFPSVVVGLISHGPMRLDSRRIPNGKTMMDFRRDVLEEGYRRCLVWPAPRLKGRPRLVLVSRAGRDIGRVILNLDGVVRAAQEAGFDVVVFEPTPFTYLCDVYRLINGSHAMVGVHGAALTHSLFLQPGSVFIQIVPLGNEWLAGTYFRGLAEGLRLEYLEYKVMARESSLVERYGMDHVMVREASSVASKNWSELHSVYLKGQDVRLDIGRFRGYLRNAYDIAKRLMQEQGLSVRRRPRLVKRSYVKPLFFN